MRKILTAGTALAAILGGVGAANAALITTTATGDGISTGCNGTSSTGTFGSSCSGGNISSLQITASGVPVLPNPDLSATTLTVSSTGPGTITIDVVQSGLTSFTGALSVLFTTNNLIGAGVGPFVLTADGTGLSQTFSGAGNTTLSTTVSGLTTDSADFTLTFGTGLQNLDATIEIQSVPEPASLAMVGAGLLVIGGLFGWRKRQQGLAA